MAVDSQSLAHRTRQRAAIILESLFSPRSERQREVRRIVGLCVPFLILVTFLGFFPLVEMVRISVSESQFVTQGFTLDAYRVLVTDPYYRRIAFNSLWFAAATTIAAVAVAVPVAHALAKYDLLGDLNYSERNIVEKLFQTYTMRVGRFHETWNGSQLSVERWLTAYTVYYNLSGTTKRWRTSRRSKRLNGRVQSSSAGRDVLQIRHTDTGDSSSMSF